MTEERSRVEFGTSSFEYVVRRTTRRKTVSIAVDDGELLITAPRGTPIERLDGIVHSRGAWILRALRAQGDSAPVPAPREFVSGETFLYAGRQHTLRVLVGGPAGVTLDHGRLVVRVRKGSEAARRSEARVLLESWFRSRAEERLPGLVAQWARRMACEPTGLRVADQRRRWGSCSASGEVRLNWRVMGAPKRLLEYVIVHELTHLAHPDHNSAFWRTLGRALPDFEERRTRLRDLGPRLVW